MSNRIDKSEKKYKMEESTPFFLLFVRRFVVDRICQLQLSKPDNMLFTIISRLRMNSNMNNYFLLSFIIMVILVILLRVCCCSRTKRKEKKQRQLIEESNIQTRQSYRTNHFINEVNEIVQADESSSRKVKKIVDLLRDLNKNDFLKLKNN